MPPPGLFAEYSFPAMDKVYRSYYSIIKPKLEHMPSFYWQRQCYATFMDDPIGVELIRHMGAHTAMWSIDYPHPESVFGYAGDVAKSVYDALGHEDAKMVLGGTAARLYKL
jgi:hypothetical protein